jgi:hypothetical protein
VAQARALEAPPRLPPLSIGARARGARVTLSLDEKVLALHRALQGARIPHAFGGALALAYWATPRGTVDIDVNVFLGADQAERVLRALAPLGVEHGELPLAEIRKRGQARLRWEHTPVELFFSYDALHDGCLERTRSVPFGDGVSIPILSAEDLSIFKVIFDRPKDWSDLAEILFTQGPDFDAGYALDWLRRILTADDARLARFEALVRDPSQGPSGPRRA